MKTPEPSMLAPLLSAMFVGIAPAAAHGNLPPIQRANQVLLVRRHWTRSINRHQGRHARLRSRAPLHPPHPRRERIFVRPI